jgi:hypothetical protein
MIEVTGTGQDNWVFDHVWPRVNVVLEQVIQDVKEHAPETRVLGHASKRPQNRFGVSVDFYKYAASDLVETVGIIVSCGTYVTSARDTSLDFIRTRITCRSELFEGERENAHSILQGPALEFALGNDERVRHSLDQWVDATVTFLDRNTNVIIVELMADN